MPQVLKETPARPGVVRIGRAPERAGGKSEEGEEGRCGSVVVAGMKGRRKREKVLQCKIAEKGEADIRHRRVLEMPRTQRIQGSQRRAN